MAESVTASTDKRIVLIAWERHDHAEKMFGQGFASFVKAVRYIYMYNIALGRTHSKSVLEPSIFALRHVQGSNSVRAQERGE